jgi:hypothetical protein
MGAGPGGLFHRRGIEGVLMQPNIQLNWLAIGVSVVASFAIGSVWYGVLFGKVWARAMGFAEGWRPPTSEMVRASLLNVVGTFFMAYVLAHEVQVWRASVWNAGQDQSDAVYAFYGAFFPWIGFLVPVLLNGVAYERKPWKVFWINAGYHFVTILAMTTILSHWR